MSQSGTENDQTTKMLALIEQAFLKMITGLFRFIGVYLPQWFYQIGKGFFDSLARFFVSMGRFLVRLVRVVVVASVWGAIVFGPLVIYLSFRDPSAARDSWVKVSNNEWRSPFWYDLETYTVTHLLVLSWAAICLIGSFWALQRSVIQNRKTVSSNAIVDGEMAAPENTHKPPGKLNGLQILFLVFAVIMGILSYVAKQK